MLSDAALQKAKEMELDISFAIADANGIPRTFQRFGEALVLSTILVPNKAYTSTITQTATKELAKVAVESGALSGIHSADRRITYVAGGFPLFYQGKIIGAIGIGGGSEEQDCTNCFFNLLKGADSRQGNTLKDFTALVLQDSN